MLIRDRRLALRWKAIRAPLSRAFWSQERSLGPAAVRDRIVKTAHTKSDRIIAALGSILVGKTPYFAIFTLIFKQRCMAVLYSHGNGR